MKHVINFKKGGFMSDLDKFLVTLSPADIADIEAALTTISSKLGFLVNLTPEERKELRNIGTRRMGYMSGVYSVAMDFSDVVPAKFKLADFTTQKALADQLQHINNLSSSLQESIGDTRMLLHSILLKRADICYNFIKTAAQNDSALSEIARDLGVIHTHKSPAAAKIMTLKPGETIKVDNVKPETLFYNKGTRPVKFKAGAQLSGKVRSAEIYVGPEQAAIIPASWVALEVTNEATDSDAIISIRMNY
jgi:hypothetical protein